MASYLILLLRIDCFYSLLGEEVGPAWNSNNKRTSGNRVLAGNRADNNWYLQD